ncbi:hypothetical protein COL81_05525 [Bacillus toyonensis]|uniref:SIR2 family protein n=1 Tax=Bacillus toyonensis TaxID=155322 RepID=UPI000BEDC2F5|nr:SIR2 family protein [Bacillus toyonensis]PEB17097.1 hypothetical protein COO08_18570 [Bacillus toyonensis]PEF99080.1 hypothetical protein COO01_08835 [Bacillus toyonensis]PGA41648.1 hypothetical protein COL81_05525 [Bacillus toyonensis]PHD92203.1 hypothetical protein COF55_10440 [Bacillus toyonensis]PHG26823.1 hypothetical protein COI60_32035 [Bacillus toyonensis]
MEKFLQDLRQTDSAPFLFLGSGFSQRYIGSPNWENLLKECASWTDKSYEEFVSEVTGLKSDDPMYLPYIAKLIAEDFRSIWFRLDKYKESKEKNIHNIINYMSPLKIVTAELLKQFKLNNQSDPTLIKEIDALRNLNTKNSIDGIITTNWDCLAEEIFGYLPYIGQEQLLFSNVLNVGEIFKIHGCVTNPNSMVFDIGDYTEFNKRNHYLASKLTTIFIEHPIIFIGYSLRDDNIRGILDAIIFGIGEEQQKQLGKRIFFLEFDFEDAGFLYTTMPIDLPSGKFEITYIRTDDFISIFEALAENERKFSARLVRQMKSHLYKLLLTDDPKEQIYVTTDLQNPEESDDIQFVYGAGVIEKLSPTGYSIISDKSLLKDIVDLNEEKLDYTKIVTDTLLMPNKYHLPMNKFIAESGIKSTELSTRIQKNIITNHTELIPPSKEKLAAKVNSQYSSLITLIQGSEQQHKKIEFVLYLTPEKIDLTIMKRFIISNFHLLDHPKQHYRTNIKKLIKYYDWLKYGQLVLC